MNRRRQVILLPYPAGTALRLPKKFEEETQMFCDKANKCIECTVRQCAHHCDDANYCSLDKIRVGTHECDPTVEQCTDCLSFAKK